MQVPEAAYMKNRKFLYNLDKLLLCKTYCKSFADPRFSMRLTFRTLRHGLLKHSLFVELLINLKLQSSIITIEFGENSRVPKVSTRNLGVKSHGRTQLLIPGVIGKKYLIYDSFFVAAIINFIQYQHITKTINKIQYFFIF